MKAAFARALDASAFLLPLAAYAWSLSPRPDSWDYGEYETVPYILGIAHGPGFPAYVLAGWLFSHAIAIGTVAFRLKFVSALFIAGSALLVRRLALSFGANEVPAFLAALVFSCTGIAWEKAVHADVHAMAIFCSLLTFVSAMAYARTQSVRFLISAAAAFGIGLATHPNVMWTGLALVPGFLAIVKGDRRMAALVAIAAVAPLAAYAYLPIRSAVIEASREDPAEAAPIFGEGDVVWDTNRPSSLAGFRKEVLGSSSSTGAFGGFLAFSRYPAFASDWAVAAARELTPTTIVLAAVGIGSLRRAERRIRTAAIFVLAGAFAAIPFTFSFGAERDVTRYLFASLAVTVAVAACAGRVAPRFRLAATGVVACTLVAIVSFLYGQNAFRHGSRDDRLGQTTIERVAGNTPGSAIVLSSWIELTPLAYAAYVDRSLGSRVPLEWLRNDVPSYRDWSRTHDVFVLTDFVNSAEVLGDIPSACLRRVADFGDLNTVYQIRCPFPTEGSIRY